MNLLVVLRGKTVTLDSLTVNIKYFFLMIKIYPTLVCVTMNGFLFIKYFTTVNFEMPDHYCVGASDCIIIGTGVSLVT